MITHGTAACGAIDSKRQRAQSACLDYENAVAEFGYNSGEAMAARLFMGATLQELRRAQARQRRAC